MSDNLRWFVVLQDDTTILRCWVDKKVAVGNTVTLKDSDEPERWWTVEYVSSQAKTAAMLGNQRGWHVGGL